MKIGSLKSTKKARGAKQNVRPSLVQWRFIVVIVTVALVFGAIAARAAYIQVIAPDNLIEQGDSRTLRTRNMPSYRGIIADRNGVEMAVSVPVQAIYADPKIVHQKNGWIRPAAGKRSPMCWAAMWKN